MQKEQTIHHLNIWRQPLNKYSDLEAEVRVKDVNDPYCDYIISLDSIYMGQPAKRINVSIRNNITDKVLSKHELRLGDSLTVIAKQEVAIYVKEIQKERAKITLSAPSNIKIKRADA